MLLTKNLKKSLVRIPLMLLGKKTEEEGEEIEEEEKFTSSKKKFESTTVYQLPFSCSAKTP